MVVLVRSARSLGMGAANACVACGSSWRVLLLATVVAILFSSVLTAHALFHMNGLSMRVLMLNPPPPPSDLTFSPFVTFLDLGKDKGEKNLA